MNYFLLKEKIQAGISKGEEHKKEQSRTTKKLVAPEKKAAVEKWYRDIKAQFGNLTDYYKVLKEISRGAYGVVYKGIMLNAEKMPSTLKVAIKAMFPHIHHQLILTEVNFLKLFRGVEGIVQLVDLRITNDQFFIVTEYFKHIHFEVKKRVSIFIITRNIFHHFLCWISNTTCTLSQKLLTSFMSMA
jgi:Serine/threonine protein kinase